MDPLEDAPPLDDEDGDEPEAPAPSPTATSRGSSTRSATSSRSRASSCSRPSPTTAPRTRSPARRSTSAAAYGAGERRPIPGVGAAIADKITELATTGRMAYYDKLRAEIPATLVELLRIPGVGPKTVRIVWEALGDRETSPDLKQAGPGGQAPDAQGHLGEHRAADPRGHREARDAPAPDADPPGAGDVGRPRRSSCAASPGVTRVVQAGSLRRRRETIGDLDLLVETDRPDAGHRAVHAPRRRWTRSSARARRRRRSRVLRGPQVDLMVMPPGEAGTYLIHFTGSADHNIRLRGHRPGPRLEPVREGLRPDRRGGQAARGRRRRPPHVRGRGRRLRRSSTSPYIEPELREDRGEIEAALRGPAADPHHARATSAATSTRHSEWSDGVHPIEVMAEAARRRGYELPGAHRPLPEPRASRAAWTPDRVEQQREIIAALNARFAAEEAARRAPARAPNPGGFRLLHGCELEVRADGAARLRGRRSSPGSTSSSPPSTSPASQPRARADQRARSTAIRSPARRRHRPPVGPDDPDPRRPRPRLGRGVRGGRRDRDRARDERLAAPPGPRRRARPPGAGARAASCRSTPTPTGPRSWTTCAGAWTRRGARGWSRGTCSTRCRATSCSPGSRASRRASDAAPDDLRARRRTIRGDAPCQDRPRPPRARARRRHCSSRSRASWSRADAFLISGLLPVVMLLAGTASSRRSGNRRPFEHLLIPAVLTGGAGAAIHLVPRRPRRWSRSSRVFALAPRPRPRARDPAARPADRHHRGRPGAGARGRGRHGVRRVHRASRRSSRAGSPEPGGAAAGGGTLAQGWLVVLAFDDALDRAACSATALAVLRYGTAADAARSALTYAIVDRGRRGRHPRDRRPAARSARPC